MATNQKVGGSNPFRRTIIERSLFTRQLKVSWSFNSIKERLEIKLKKIAIIEAYHKIINNEEYFLYSKLKYYELKGFDNFIKAIDEGLISISFQIGVYKSGEKKGKRHDRGTNFSISIEDIESIYEKKYET